jgi:hypothetical protein
MIRPSLSLLLLLSLSCSSSGAGSARSVGDAGSRADVATSRSDGGHETRDSGARDAHARDAHARDAAADVQTFPEIGDASVGIVVAYSPFPQALAIEGADLYWTDGQDNAVLTVAKGGGAPTTLASGLQNPGRIAVDGTGVYFVDAQNTAIESIALDGGTPTTLASFPDCSISGLAIDTTTVYWSDLILNAILSVPKAGGAPVTLFQETGSSVHAISSLAIDDASIYWLDSATGAVSSVPKAGGAAKVLTDKAASPGGIVVDDTDVYYSQTASGPATLFSLPKTGGVPSALADQASSSGLALDAHHVYFLDGQNLSVWSVPKTGGTTVELGTGDYGAGANDNIPSVAVDSADVYWIADFVANPPGAGDGGAGDAGTADASDASDGGFAGMGAIFRASLTR